MADTVDARLTIIAERHVRALAEDMPLQAQLLILDADALLDAKLAARPKPPKQYNVGERGTEAFVPTVAGHGTRRDA